MLTPTTDDVRAELRGMGLGAGTSVANPLEVPFGPAAGVDALRTVIEPILARQSYPNLLVHVNTSVYYSFGTGGVSQLIDQLADLATVPLDGARLAVVLRNLDFVPAVDAAELLDRGAGTGLGHVPHPRRRRGRGGRARRALPMRVRHERHAPEES